MPYKAFISSSAGLELTSEEFSFFREEKPCGYILFQRNCETPAQVKRLIASVKEAIGTERLLVLIDQEGGRVARLAPPEWPAFPSAHTFGMLYTSNPERAIEAARLCSQYLASQLYELGITVNCVPVLDVPAPGADDIIGTRAYGTEPDIVIALGRAVMEGHMSAGVLPVIKHIPGHGRADADSHLSLPTVTATLDELEQIDFAPFKALNEAPLGMTGHLLIPALDPQDCVSTSQSIIRDIIRGSIGFDGALMSDDLSMGALEGSLAQRTEAVIAAGCDLALHCNGDFEEMTDVAAYTPELHGNALRRVNHALSLLHSPTAFDHAHAEIYIRDLLNQTLVT